MLFKSSLEMVNLPFKDETYFVVLAVNFISIKTYPLQSLSWRLVDPVYTVVSKHESRTFAGGLRDPPG